MPTPTTPLSFPFAEAFGCLNCERTCAALDESRCPVCQSLNVFPLSVLFEAMKMTVLGTGSKARLVVQLPARAHRSTEPHE